MENITTLHSLVWVQLPSKPDLFIYFPIFFCCPLHWSTLWNYGKAIFYPKAAGCHGLREPYLSPGWFCWLETLQEGGAEEKEMEAGRTKSSRDGALLDVLGCYLWGPSTNHAQAWHRMWICLRPGSWGKMG